MDAASQDQRLTDKSSQLDNANTSPWQGVSGIAAFCPALSPLSPLAKVRLCGLTMPEKDQPLGLNSINHLSDLMAQGSGKVILVLTDTEQPDHVVAEVFLPIANREEEIHANSQMLSDDIALVNPQSVHSCPNEGPMRTAESNAKRAERGVWVNPTATKPQGDLP